MVHKEVAERVPFWYDYLLNQNGSVTCFVATHITASLYLSHLLSSQPHIRAIDLDAAQTSAHIFLQELLLTTFLGESHLYLIKSDLNTLSDYELNQILSFFSQYNGPHRLFCFMVPEKVKLYEKKIKFSTVALPETVTKNELIFLMRHVKIQDFVVNYIFDMMVPDQDYYPVALFFVLLMYLPVLSKAMLSDFLHAYAPLLISNSFSLFQLSKKFFAKDMSFFSEWVNVQPHYSLLFWTTFWVDQCNKAALFCLYKKQNGLADAQVVAKGLPFTFINKDWTKYEPAFLIEYAYAFYEYDLALKYEMVYRPLDVLFINFFKKK